MNLIRCVLVVAVAAFLGTSGCEAVDEFLKTDIAQFVDVPGDLGSPDDPGANVDPGVMTDPGNAVEPGTGGCGDLWECYMACENEACADACIADASLAARGMMGDVFDCINDTCDQYEDEDDWLACANTSIDTDGACEVEIAACFADGGVEGTEPCGTLWNCFMGCEGAEACQQTCAAEATQMARELMLDVFDCFNQACVEFADDDDAWTVCANEAIGSGGACETEMSACVGDGANS